MRGIPWIRFSLMAVALAFFAVPIWLLTRTDAPVGVSLPAVQSRPTQREVTLEIETAPAAQRIGISYLGRELVPLEHTGGTYSGTVKLPADSAADLLVTARWNGTGLAALRVRASDENGPLAETSFWGSDQMQDVFTVPKGQQ
jgi:hypothetical protein